MKSKIHNALRKIAAQYNDLLGDLGDNTAKVTRNFVGQWEGRRVNDKGMHVAYPDVRGVTTIGYGMTDPKIIAKYPNGMPEKTAQRLFHNRLMASRDALSKWKNWDKLNPNQQASLISWHYNVGHGAADNSTLKKRVEGAEFDLVPEEMNRWVFANKKRIPGLVNRRAAEATLYNKTWAVAKEPTHLANGAVLR